MATYYVNADSTSEDGLTPGTGWHNFSRLVSDGASVRVELQPQDVVKVVDATSYILETGAYGVDQVSPRIGGTVEPYDATTYPKILGSYNSYGYGILPALSLKSDATVRHLAIYSNNNSASIVTRTLTENTLIEECKFDATGSGHSAAPIAGSGNTITVRNCSYFLRNRLTTAGSLFINSSASNSETNKAVIVNNSFYVHYSSTPGNILIGVYTVNGRLEAYNNIVFFDHPSVTFTSFSLWTEFHSGFPAGTVHNNLWGPIVLGGVYTTDASGTLVSATNIPNSDPLYIDAPSKNLAIPENSPAVSAAVINSYTPAYDILLHQRAYPYDIGAYEFYRPFSFSYFDTSSVVDGTFVTPYLGYNDLVSAIYRINPDSYFDSTQKIGRVDVYYNHADGSQQKRVTFNNWPRNEVMWSENARDGVWQKTKIEVFDKDGALTSIPRSSIGPWEDCTHSGGHMTLNLST